MPNRPVFDFHARLAPRPGAVDGLVAMLDSCGLDRAALAAGGTIELSTLSRQLVDGGHVETDADNDAVLAACAGSDGRFVPFFFANPHRPVDWYAKRAAEFVGLEISPAVHGVPLTDDRTAELVAVAASVGHPVYVVCLIRPGSGVADLVRLATHHPDATFVLGHSGTGNIDFHAVDLIAGHANILLETSGGYTTVLRAALRQLGSERLLFGSEYPLQHPNVELVKFDAVSVTPADWERIAWRNAHRLLGLEQ
ncbi:MAG TPA: amidohydrolase family protein [Pseudonocardiaceae bacterium]|nr:amidohydrolase family protein [Pseudonocardiaceae bacterium]